MNTIKKLALLGSILSIGAAYGMESQTVEVEQEIVLTPPMTVTCSEEKRTVIVPKELREKYGDSIQLRIETVKCIYHADYGAKKN